jgi:CRP-like cAMP-binding protein
MPELLYKKISSVISITEEEFNFFQTLFVRKKLRRRQYLLQEGNVCKYQAFVVKGLLRSYTVDEKGNEHVLQFSSEGWWVADLSSYLTNEPMLKVPAFEHYFRIIIQNHLVATQKRLLQSLTQTTEEKYNRFLEAYPECVQRLPQHQIASYLGVTRETLSRLRKQMAIRK